MSETIICGEGQDSYEVTIFLYQNLRQKLHRAFNTQGKTGEDLVNAIVASGGVMDISRTKDKQFIDGPNGEPGERRFYSSGVIKDDWHYKDGHVTSIVRFHDNGQVESVRRYEYNEKTGSNRIRDTANGEAATEDYDRNGGLIKVGRSDGTRNKHATDYSNSIVVKYLDATEVAAYAATFNKAPPSPAQETPAVATKTKTSPVKRIVSSLKRRL